jgi:hypothetical protein
MEQPEQLALQGQLDRLEQLGLVLLAHLELQVRLESRALQAPLGLRVQGLRAQLVLKEPLEPKAQQAPSVRLDRAQQVQQALLVQPAQRAQLAQQVQQD